MMAEVIYIQNYFFYSHRITNRINDAGAGLDPEECSDKRRKIKQPSATEMPASGRLSSGCGAMVCALP
jgi:hypothetical protein